MGYTFENDAVLFITDASGVYCPQRFAKEIKRNCVKNVRPEDWAILESGPDNELYWDAWTSVLDNAEVTDPSNGITYHVHQDGDVWLVPIGADWGDRNE